MFNQQHYKVIANIIKHQVPIQNVDLISKDRLINALCTYPSIDNPRFNEEKFRSACN